MKIQYQILNWTIFINAHITLQETKTGKKNAHIIIQDPASPIGICVSTLYNLMQSNNTLQHNTLNLKY